MLRNYYADQVMVIAGPVLVEGYADGSFVSIEQNEDAFALQVGTDGEACRSRTNNNSGTVTLTLGQWSASNDLLSALHAGDRLSPNGDGIVPLVVIDKSGRTLCAAEKAWIRKPPAVEFGREAGSREWVFETDNIVMGVGGNN
jgi:hypothetical protein